MLVLVWIALALAVLAPAAAFVFALRAGLRAWRDFRSLSRGVSAGLADLTGRLERFADRLSSTPTHADELEKSLERLRVSRARVAVLQTAVDEAADAVGRITVFYPRK